MAAWTVGIFVVAASYAAAGQPAQDPDWPCIQRLVPALSAGQIWRGPSIDRVGGTWTGDPEIVSLVAEITSRRVSIDEAVSRTEAFASGLGAGQADRLTLLFAGIFQRIDESRGDAITAIKRYDRGQRGMVDAISADLAQLEALRQDPEMNAERIEDLLGGVEINRRIFADRQRALRPLCEQPVLMEERLGALARAIMTHLG